MTKCIQKSVQAFRRYAANEAGVLAIIFAITIPMIAGTTGIAVDLSRSYNAKNRLCNALDQAALAAASSTGTAMELQARMKDFFAANYNDSIAQTVDVTLDVQGSRMVASATARVYTTFMQIMGEDYLDIACETEVVRELSGVEAVLVVDVTGSMAGTNITALKTASTNFVNTMFGYITDTNYIKIGIVPYSDSVNVGSYGWGLNPDGSAYGTRFVDNPATDSYVSPASNITFGTATNNWWGCVIERPTAFISDAATPNWPMYRYPRLCTRYWGDGSCRTWTTPNTSCTSARILPMTNNQTTLLSTISALPTSGNTYADLGMLWGWRVISPGHPFTEGAAYDDQHWSKTVILMTDGNNTLDSVYSGEGRRGDAGVSSSVTEINNKLRDACTAMKAEGIKIYTITFTSSISSTTKGFYRNCATTAANYYDAPSDQDLIDAFQTIANQLSQLHIAR